MSESLKIKWFYAFTGLFVAVNALLIFKEFYWFTLLPVAILLAGMAFFSTDKLLLVITFFTPFSLNLEKLTFGIGMYLPTEPLMFGLTVLFVLKLLLYWNFESKIAKHPVTIVLFLSFLWMIVTTAASEMPVVSFKFFLSRLWFVVCFYLMGTYLFRSNNKIRVFLWLYILPFGVVILYTLVRHASYGFDDKSGHWVMQPFYKDHTSYGALLAMYYPILIGLLAEKGLRFNVRAPILVVLVIFTVGLIFSYTRAAWVSLAGALVVYLLVYYRVQMSRLIMLAMIAIGCLIYMQDTILMKLEKNRQDSSSDLTEHVKSISNVATDASNLERLNRWSCALRMFMERPVFGWGPGTYMFQYAPFQHSAQLTIISTNAGDAGNAHSEYLAPLAEQGVIGAILFLCLMCAIVYTGIMAYYQLDQGFLKTTALTCTLGLVTYMIHGLLNNYLDTDKASIPFWGFTAILVTLHQFGKAGDDSIV